MKATGTDGISTEAWQATKPRGSKDFNQAMAANLRNDTIANRLEEVQSNIRKGDLTEYANCHLVILFLHANILILRIMQYRLELYTEKGMSEVQTGFKKRQSNRRYYC